jgi:hypothetical protein
MIVHCCGGALLLLTPTPPLLSVLDPAYADQNNFYGLLNSALTRASIHVGNVSYNDGNIEVEKHLLQDVAASQMSAVIDLLDTYHISVLFYNGNLDIIVKPLNPKPVARHLSFLLQCGAPLTARWIDAMEWSGSAAMASAERWARSLAPPPTFNSAMTSPRSIWRADPKGVVSGYTRAAKNLIQTVVRNAGHYVRRPAASRPFLSNPRAAAASESVLRKSQLAWCGGVSLTYNAAGAHRSA